MVLTTVEPLMMMSVLKHAVISLELHQDLSNTEPTELWRGQLPILQGSAVPQKEADGAVPCLSLETRGDIYGELSSDSLPFLKAKAVPLHAMKALGCRGGIAVTHS
jgi:hypothetical protein